MKGVGPHRAGRPQSGWDVCIMSGLMRSPRAQITKLQLLNNTRGCSFMSATSLRTIAVFHQIYNLRKIPSSIYNHCFSLLWYFPSPCSLISSDAIAGAPVAVHKVEGCEEIFFQGGHLFFFEGEGRDCFLLCGGRISPSATNKQQTTLAPNSLTTTSDKHNRLKKKRENITRDFFFISKCKRYKTYKKCYLQFCSVVFFLFLQVHLCLDQDSFCVGNLRSLCLSSDSL